MVYNQKMFNQDQFKNKDFLKIYCISDTHFYSLTDGDIHSKKGLGAIYPVDHGDWHLYAGSEKFKQFVKQSNQSDCDYVIHLGDFVQDSDLATWDIFTSNWSRINKLKEITIGNHDLLHGNSYAETVVKVGYEKREVVSESVFNRSFLISNEKMSAQGIILDTNINKDGQHEPSGSGWLQRDALQWLNSQLSKTNEELVLIFMHHGPHLYTVDKFDKEAALEYEDIVLDAIIDRKLNVITIFGHHHPQQTITFNTLDSRVKGICLSANVLNNPGYFTELTIFKDGSINVNDVPVHSS